MAAYQVQAPDKFNFSTPTEWPKWKKQFERYLLVSNLHQRTDDEKVEILMYLMGDKADDVFQTLKFTTAGDEKKLEKVLEQFESYFIVRRNVIYERALFNSRAQEEGEPVDDFITALYKLAQYCEYKTLHDEMIRDRIVVGVRDKKLSEKLQLDNALTLEKAITTVRQHEAVKKQQIELQGRPPSPQLNRVGTTDEKYSNQKRSEATPDNKCGRCGFTHWKGKSCPARDADCKKCGKPGHFASCCRSKKIEKNECPSADLKEVKTETPEEKTAFMLALTSPSPNEDQAARQKRWTATINVNEKAIDFKLDSGAEVTVLSLYEFKKKMSRQRLTLPDLRLRGADMNCIDCVGMFEAKLQHRNVEIKENIYVVRRLDTPLLSLRACETLELVKRVNVVNEEKGLSLVDPKRKYPDLFEGIGNIGSPYEIKIKDGARPFAIHTPRRVPIPLMTKLETRLNELLQMGIIKQVDEATDWCAPTVITGKPNGDIRLCVDLSKLNQSLDREIHPMPVVEHTLGQLGGARYFSKLDANSGFHQIKLHDNSQLLTTFITPFGRYCFCRLPFGITTAPEYFQKTMSLILRGIDGVICYLDDILIFAETLEEHDKILTSVLDRLRRAGVTLNEAKCKFGVEEVNFLGHIVNADGIRPDPKKIVAVKSMPEPKNVTDVRRFLGLVNHLGRFLQNLSEEAAPLNQLLRDEQDFVWGTAQKKAFMRLKEALIKHPTLAVYDVNKKTIVSADASSYGLGAVLKQEQGDGGWRPIAYASRTMTDAEKRYAQIEKEALALTWACERFSDFLIGKQFKIETDHKPLVPIFSTKELEVLTPRIQRFRMRMLRFSFEIYHTPGKDLIAADALSRSPLPTMDDAEDEVAAAAHINAVLSCLPVTDERLTVIWNAQQEDSTLKKIAGYCQNGWPEKKQLESACLEFWNVRHEIGSQNGLLMRGCRIIIPHSMRQEMLIKIHSGHLGITKCRARARETIWWPGISSQIETMIKKCTVCIQESSNRHEPLILTEFPTRPWQKIGMDLFYYMKTWYLVVVDYYSKYPEVVQLQSLTAPVVVQCCKSIFARHGVPELVISDNETQFGDPTRNCHPGASRDFKKFAEDYGFKHLTSSPHFPQSNGMAEMAVKIVKMLFKKNEDVSKALMEYRATPLQNGYSPAELLMGRKIRTTVPMSSDALTPKTVDLQDLWRKEEKHRDDYKKNYDQRHGVKALEELEPNDVVWITDMRTWGRILRKSQTPRSYEVETPRGIVRRNRYHLTKGYDVPLPETDDIEIMEPTNEEVRVQDQAPAPDPDDGIRRSRYGRVYKPVQRFTH